MKSMISRTGFFIAICFAMTTCSFGQYGGYGYGSYGGGGYGSGGYGGHRDPVRSIAGHGNSGGYGGYSGWGGYGSGGYGASHGMNSAIIPGSASDKEMPTVPGANPEIELAKKKYLKFNPPVPLSTFESTDYNWWSKEGSDSGNGYWQPGGATGRVGSPYFYSANSGSSASSLYGSSIAMNNSIVTDSNGMIILNGLSSDGIIYNGTNYVGNSIASAGFGGGESGYIGGRGRSGGTYHGSRHVFSTHPDGLYNAGQDAWGYHFGPGYYRHSERSHYRFPYYSYRRPWYFQGPASKNRDTNFAW